MTVGIRRIVVPVRGDGKGDNVLRHAAVLAHRYQAHIDVIHVRAAAEDMIPFGVAVPDYLKRQILDSAHSQADAEEDKLKAELHVLAEELNLVEDEAVIGSKATVTFTEERGRQVDMISHLGRLADLIAVPKPDKDRNLGGNTLRAAIFSSGRPVLMCPDTAPLPAMGSTIAIGWNGSIEASRAMRMSMPLIRMADNIHILTRGEKEHRHASAADLQRLLSMHGVASESVVMEDHGSVGQSLLDTSEKIGADLLIMGAYHDGYARQELFGGNARTVVERSNLPVIFAH